MNKRTIIGLVLLIVASLAMSTGCGRAYDKKTFFIFATDQQFDSQGRMMLTVFLVKNCGSGCNERNPKWPRIKAYVNDPAFFEKINKSVEQYFYLEELKEMGIELPAEKDEPDISYPGHKPGDELLSYYRVLDKRLVVENCNTKYVVVLVLQCNCNEKMLAMNSKVRLEVSVEAYDSLIKGEDYDNQVLSSLGIKLPVEKDEK